MNLYYAKLGHPPTSRSRKLLYSNSGYSHHYILLSGFARRAANPRTGRPSAPSLSTTSPVPPPPPPARGRADSWTESLRVLRGLLPASKQTFCSESLLTSRLCLGGRLRERVRASERVSEFVHFTGCYTSWVFNGCYTLVGAVSFSLSLTFSRSHPLDSLSPSAIVDMKCIKCGQYTHTHTHTHLVRAST